MINKGDMFMNKQNIYDNDEFFQKYIDIRKLDRSANSLIEIPALLNLLPDVKGKVILDIGCGTGDQCKLYSKMGAKEVLGIDISKNMVDFAKKYNGLENIKYENKAIEDLEISVNQFDIITSSLVFHYIEDFSMLLNKIYALLKKDGYLVFSQENPLVTGHKELSRWIIDDEGKKVAGVVESYSLDGEKEVYWNNNYVKKYHRKFSTLVNQLLRQGFKIEEISEPIASEEIIKMYPEYYDNNIRPDFILFKVKK